MSRFNMRDVRLPASVSWALAEHATVSAASFTLGILLMRVGGVELLGQYSAALLALQFILALQGALVTSTLLVIAQEKTEADKQTLFNQAATTCFFGALLVAVVLFALYAINPESTRGYGGGVIVAGGAWIGACMMCDIFKKILYASLNTRRAFGASLTMATLQCGGLLVIPIKAIDLQAVLWVCAMSNLGAMLVCMNVVNRPEFPARANVARFWGSSKWLVGSAIMHWVSGNSVLIAIGAALGPGTLGAVKAAQNVVGISHVFFQVIENTFPQTLRRRQLSSGIKRLQKDAYAISGAMLILGTVGTVLLYFSGETVLTLLYGQAEARTVVSLNWYGLIYTVIAVALPLRVVLKVVENTGPLFWGYVLTAGLATLFGAPMARTYGLHGAMLLMLLSQVVPLMLALVTIAEKRE